MSQADQWTGSTPPEFGDYTTEEELTVTPAPEFDGYQAIEIAPAPNTNPDPGTGTNPDPGTGSDPDAGGESAESTWWQRLYQWLLEIKTSIIELPSKFGDWFAQIITSIQAIPSAIMNGLQSLFVPDPDYFAGKVEALKAKFPIVSNVQELGNSMKGFFLSLGSKAPIIYIDLGASQWHPIGGRVKFIDLTWYSQYKPTMDTILGGFLWLWTGWRLLHAAPGIISGTAGTWGEPTSINDLTFMSYQPRLPSGNKRKKED
jgi:hypothetical protein